MNPESRELVNEERKAWTGRIRLVELLKHLGVSSTTWHRGVSTKYLDDYMNWFQGQEFRPDKRTVRDFIAEHLMSFIQGFR